MEEETNIHALEAIEATAIAQEKIEKSREIQIDTALEKHTSVITSNVDEHYTNIMTTLATLIAGQSETNKHLSILNGKVADHQKELTTLMLWKAEGKGFIGAINIGWTTLITLLSGVAAYFIFRK